MSVENEAGARDTAATVTVTVPALRREAILPDHDRGRIATLVAMCSLAGVAVGFGLSTAAMQAASEASRAVVITDVRSVDPGIERADAPYGHDTPWLGIKFHTAALDTPGAVGVVVEQVLPETPAAEAGLEPHDIIIGYDHVPVHCTGDLFRLVRSSDVGDRPVVEILRDGHAAEVQPTLVAMPARVRAMLMRR